MRPPRADAKYRVLPSADSDGEKSALGVLMPSARRCGSDHVLSGPVRRLIQMSESSLSKLDDRLKYRIVPSAFGVGNASNAGELSWGPRFTGGVHASCRDARVATYISAVPKPPARLEAKYRAFPSLESRNENARIGSPIAADVHVLRRGAPRRMPPGSKRVSAPDASAGCMR